MLQFLRGIVLIAAMVTNCGAAFAVDYNSANFIMAGCRASLLPVTEMPDEMMFQAGWCMGLVRGARDILEPLNIVCVPFNVTNEQAVRIVVKYIDDRPQRQHESFSALVIAALGAAFSCKK